FLPDQPGVLGHVGRVRHRPTTALVARRAAPAWCGTRRAADAHIPPCASRGLEKGVSGELRPQAGERSTPPPRRGRGGGPSHGSVAAGVSPRRLDLPGVYVVRASCGRVAATARKPLGRAPWLLTPHALPSTRSCTGSSGSTWRPSSPRPPRVPTGSACPISSSASSAP